MQNKAATDELDVHVPSIAGAIIPNPTNSPCELIRDQDGYLYVICTTCRETCTLQLGQQRRSTSGHGQNTFQVECPKCGPLRPPLLSKW
jgi:hypothetical protein